MSPIYKNQCISLNRALLALRKYVLVRIEWVAVFFFFVGRETLSPSISP